MTVGASRSFETVRAIFNWAKRRKLVAQNPTDGMDKPFKTGRRDRYLTESELKRFWAELNSAAEKEASIVAVLKLMLLTAQRQGEIRRMQWSDLDIEGGWWNAPGERTKTGRPYRIALTPRALATIERFRGIHETFVFPSRSGNGPLLPFDVNHWVSAARDRAEIKDFVPHDIRHTVATSLARMGVRDEVIARVLNHAAQVPMTAKYIEHTYDDEKRRALQLWERQLLEIAGEANRQHRQQLGKTKSRMFPETRHTFAQQSGRVSARRIGTALASARLASRYNQ